ncbi:MAG: hypothetical protein WAT19_00180 [Ferruginibacter sp.]
MSIFCFSQTADSIKSVSHFSGSISVTHNGLSFIPTFSLGKPATIFNLSMGKKKLSFEPEIRFSLAAKPWSFLFWWRYKLLNTKKFSLRLGAHPAMNFREETVTVNGISKNVMVSRRYVAGELTPNYLIEKNISIGMYYLYSRGIDDGTAKNTHFITCNTNFSYIPLKKGVYMKFIPQLYYLKMDQYDGSFFTSSVSLAKRNFPLSIIGIINKRIRSNIAASKNFVWNTSLVYSFGKKYTEKAQL